jgi:hypothetical protein
MHSGVVDDRTTIMHRIWTALISGGAAIGIGIAGAGVAAAESSTVSLVDQVAPGGATTTAPSTAPYPPPSGTVPAGWPILVDDTQTIAVAVPPAWTEVDTVAAQNDDGTPRPWIAASGDLADFLGTDGTDTYGVPGMIYAALPPTDPAGLLSRSVYHQVCAPGVVQTFANFTFTGVIQSFDACGGTPTRVVQAAGLPADGSFTGVVLVQLVGDPTPDDAIVLDGILGSFGRHVPPS